MTNYSLWHNNLIKYPKLEKDIKCSTLIIGGGLSGLSTAYYLSKNNECVVLVDKYNIGGLTSANSSAHITLQHDLVYQYYLKHFGLNKTKKIAKANIEAISEIKRIVDEENIDCDLEMASSILTTNEVKNIKKIEKEYNAYKRVGIKSTLLENEESFLVGLNINDQMHFNPVKYANGLASCILKNGGKIYTDTLILKVNKTYASTKDYNIYFKRVVIATHNPIINFPGLYFSKVYLSTSYSIAYSGKITYMSNSIDKDGLTFRGYKDLIIAGGMDHRSACIKENLKKLVNLFKDKKVIAYWQAQDGVSPDRLPYIGKYSRKRNNIYVITAFGKWGMTNSNIAGRIISDKILNNYNECADIYSPQRIKGPLILLRLLVLNLRIMKSYLLGLFKIKSKTCPHMYGKTYYNKENNTYCCSCHSSTFSNKGECLDGPSVKNLSIPRS